MRVEGGEQELETSCHLLENSKTGPRGGDGDVSFGLFRSKIGRQVISNPNAHGRYEIERHRHVQNHFWRLGMLLPTLPTASSGLERLIMVKKLRHESFGSEFFPALANRRRACVMRATAVVGRSLSHQQ